MQNYYNNFSATHSLLAVQPENTKNNITESLNSTFKTRQSFSFAPLSFCTRDLIASLFVIIYHFSLLPNNIYCFFCRIIVSHYQDICESVRTSVIDIFFDEEFLKFYSKQKLNHQIVRLNIEGHLQRILQSETVDQLITTELHSLASSPEGQLLSSVGIKLSSLRSLVKPYVVDLLTDVVPVLMERFTSYSQVGKYKV